MKTLISMTDFVLEQRMTSEDVTKASFFDIQTHIHEYYDKVYAYAAFLKQPLKLEMFVPCDENGNVLQEPKEKVFSRENGAYEFDEYCKIYEQTKEKVLFEGFEYIETENYFFVFNEEKLVRLQRSNFKTETIEFIAGQEVELTPTALKQIGL